MVSKKIIAAALTAALVLGSVGIAAATGFAPVQNMLADLDGSTESTVTPSVEETTLPSIDPTDTVGGDTSVTPSPDATSSIDATPSSDGTGTAPGSEEGTRTIKAPSWSNGIGWGVTGMAPQVPRRRGRPAVPGERGRHLGKAKKAQPGPADAEVEATKPAKVKPVKAKSAKTKRAKTKGH